MTALSTFLALQLLFFALGWLDLGLDGGNTTVARGVISGVLALIAFFLGGLAAGSSALWTRPADGMVNGVVAWAAAVLALLVVALLGGGALFGALADVAGQLTDLRQVDTDFDVGAATRTAQDTAGWAALGLGLSALAAAVGGSVGANLWPGRSRTGSDPRI